MSGGMNPIKSLIRKDALADDKFNLLISEMSTLKLKMELVLETTKELLTFLNGATVHTDSPAQAQTYKPMYFGGGRND